MFGGQEYYSGSSTMDADHLQVEHQMSYPHHYSDVSIHHFDHHHQIAAMNANMGNRRSWESVDQHHHHHHQADGLDQLQCFSTSPANFHVPSYTPAPDLLNLLHMPPAQAPSANLSFNGFGQAHELFGGEAAAGENQLLYDTSLQLNFGGHDHFHPMAMHGLGLAGGGFFDAEADGVGAGNGETPPEFGLVKERGRKGGRGRGGNKAEKQRREAVKQKFEALRAMVPNPTRDDRASIIQDAIDYIKELQRSVEELKFLVEKKKNGMSKKLKNSYGTEDEKAASNGEIEGNKDNPEQDGEHCYNNGSSIIRSSWLLRKSKDTVVDVRIIDDEVNIKLTTQRRKMNNFLLLVAKILHELQLCLLQVAGGNIGDHFIFMFNTKISEGSSLYASAIAKRLIEGLEMHYTAFPDAIS